MTLESADSKSSALPDEVPDDAVWDDARMAMANLESVANTGPRWLAGLLALILALLLLLGSFVANRINASRSQETLDWIQHSNTVIDQSARTNMALLRVGVAMRSYALTGSEFHANSYREYKTALGARLDELVNLTADDPPQQQRATKLKGLIEGYMAGYDPAGGPAVPNRQDITSRLSDPLAAQKDRQFGAQIRTQFSAIGAAEHDVLAGRRNIADRDQRAMQIIADACIVLAILSGALSLLLIQGARARNRLRELQREFMHTQRLALMGQTSVAIAHEVNQPLTAASNYLAVLRNISAGGGNLPPEKAKEIVPKIEVQIRRASEIVQRLRNFLTVRGGERVSETPKTLIADAVDLLGTLDNTIKLETHIELGLPPVLVDRVEIQQVLVNLMRNALEAMKDQSQRRLVLKASVMPGSKIKITIEDNGTGLPDQVAKNLFKPFVSSKRGGMGVGLSICQTIVAAHGGRIWADSTPKGTAFHFTLPVAREE